MTERTLRETFQKSLDFSLSIGLTFAEAISYKAQFWQHQLRIDIKWINLSIPGPVKYARARYRKNFFDNFYDVLMNLAIMGVSQSFLKRYSEK